MKKPTLFLLLFFALTAFASASHGNPNSECDAWSDCSRSSSGNAGQNIASCSADGTGATNHYVTCEPGAPRGTCVEHNQMAACAGLDVCRIVTNGGEGSGEDAVPFLDDLTDVARCLSAQCIPGTNCAACLGGTCGNTCLTKNGKDYAITVTCDRQGVGGELHYCNYPSIQLCQFGCENGACKPAATVTSSVEPTGAPAISEALVGQLIGPAAYETSAPLGGFVPYENKSGLASASAVGLLVLLLIAGYSVVKK